MKEYSAPSHGDDYKSGYKQEEKEEVPKIDYKDLYEKEKQEKEVFLNCSKS